MKKILALVLAAAMFIVLMMTSALAVDDPSVGVIGSDGGHAETGTEKPAPDGVATPTSLSVMPLSASWTQYGRSGHASASGDTVSFQGHPMDPFCVLLYRAATDGDYRTFTFHLSEGVSDWHTIEGSGFIFNANISGNAISGNAVLFGQSSVTFYQMTNVSLSAFSGSHFSSLSGVTEIRSTPKPSFSSGSTWYLKLRVSPGSLTFEKYPNAQFTGTPEPIFDNIPISAGSGASGYGPFGSFVSHDCEVISSSRFDYFNITIAPNTPPQVTAPDVVLNRGASFTPMSGVAASDNEDGDLTGKVQITANNVNTQVPGVYNVTYSVSDILGLTATHTRKVTVRADVEFTVVDKASKAPLSNVGIKLMSGSAAGPVVPDTNSSGKAQVILDTGAYSYEITKGAAEYITPSGATQVNIDSSSTTTWPMPIIIELEKKVYDAGIAMTATSEALKYGETATFSITLTNNGNQAVIPIVDIQTDDHIAPTQDTASKVIGGKLKLSAPIEPGKSIAMDLAYTVTSLHASAVSQAKAVISGLTLADGTTVPDGNPANNSADANVNIKNLPVIFLKVDAENGNRLAGAKIIITNSAGKQVYSGASDKDGQFTVHDLLPDSYVISEQLPPAGYKLSDKTWTFTRAADSSVSGTKKIPNDPTQLLVTNIEKDTKERLNGGIFVLMQKGADGKEAFKRTITGKGEELLKIIRPGSYILKQVQAPAGYKLCKDELPIEVSDKGVVSGVSEIVNEPIVVTITKTDEEKKPVEGSTIEVYDAAQKKIAEGISDKNGQIKLLKLAPGKYTYKETKASPGYSLNAAIYSFSVEEDGEVKGDLSFINKLAVVTVQKNDPDGKPVAGASLEVYDSLGKKVADGKTDIAGQLKILGLVPGRYTYKETAVPTTFALNTKVHAFELKADGTSEGELIIVNEYSFVKYLKIDKATRAPLANARFGLFDTVTGREVMSAVSGMDGIVLFSRIPHGSYEIRETAAPESYTLSGKTITLQVTDTYLNPVETPVIENSPAPQTGVDGFPWWGVLILVIVVLGAAACGLWLYVRSKRA